MQRVYLSLTLVVLIVGGYFVYTNNFKEKGVSEEKEPLTNAPIQAETSTTPPLGSSSTENTSSDPKTMIALFKTNKGEIGIEFFSDQAPKTVENFVKLARAGFYDGTRFHRVIKGFMVQGGDPLSKDVSQAARWGTGGPGYAFEDEIGPDNHNMTGTISMANAGPDTNGSQFFINAVDNNFLDSKHTVFGRVVSGMDVVRAIESTPTDPSNNRPLSDMIIEKVTISAR